MERTKICTKCEEIKPFDEFYNLSSGKDGKNNRCKLCMKRTGKSTGIPTKGATQRREKYFTEFKTNVENMGGTCLGVLENYQNAKSPLLIRCEDGHEWESNITRVKTSWCPHCTTFLGESVSLQSCVHLFNKPFKKIRPDWLHVAGLTKGNLELDIYNEELHLAVEYNGPQHYKFVPRFHKTQEAFEQRLEHDKLKAKICKERGIFLIVIKYDIEIKDICQYISTAAEIFGITQINKICDFNVAHAKVTNTRTKKVTQLVEEKNGTIISADFLGGKSTIVIECHKKHTWTTKITHVEQGRWCRDCGFEKLQKCNKTPEGLEKMKLSHQKRVETVKTKNADLLKNTTTKQCTGKCGTIKPFDDFYKAKQGALGYRGQCKECARDHRKRKYVEKSIV